MVFWSICLPIILADKNTPADVGRFLNCRLPLTPLDYGKTYACLFRDITHTRYLHSANRAEGRTHRLCGQIKAVLWLFSARQPIRYCLTRPFCAVLAASENKKAADFFHNHYQEQKYSFFIIFLLFIVTKKDSKDFLSSFCCPFQVLKPPSPNLNLALANHVHLRTV